MRLTPSKKYDFKTLFDFDIVGVLTKLFHFAAEEGITYQKILAVRDERE